MPSTKEKPAATNTGRPGAIDAIALLKKDHREVKSWFDEYEKTKGVTKKSELAGKICHALTVHMQIEEELFYPAARKATGDDDLLDEAAVEHAAATQLIAEIEAMSVEDDLYDAKIKVLGEQIEHHVEEEEDKLFPHTQKTKLDLATIGRELSARKAALMAELDT